MSHVKNYDVGQIRLDLLRRNTVSAPPFVQYTHELPLLSFGDVQHNVNLSLVFNYERYRSEIESGTNPYHIAPGFKLNLQKRLLHTQLGIFTDYQDESGKITQLNNFYGNYTLDDDSQRIIRQKARPGQTDNTSGGNSEMGGDNPVYDYILENADYSKEKYDESGRIIAVYDKYSDTAVLTYAYDTDSRLSTITFRNGNAITLTYESNLLKSITYHNQTSTFAYDNGMLDYVAHYTGVKYYYSLSQAVFAAQIGFDDLPESDFKVTATSVEGSETVTYAKELKLADSGETIDMIDYVGANVVNKESYKLSKNIVAFDPPFSYVDIIDNNGVETRVQYYNGKPMFSYEIKNGSPVFERDITPNCSTNRYVGNVTLYNANGTSGADNVSGVQTINNGKLMGYSSHSTTHYWCVAIPDTNERNGLYTVSGWIKSNAVNMNAINFCVGDGESCFNEYGNAFEVNVEHNGQWQYFSVLHPVKATTLYVTTGVSEEYEVRDVRVTFQGFISQTDDNESGTVMSGCVLLNGEREVSFYKAQFFYKLYNSSEDDDPIAINSEVSFADVLRYKIRLIRDGVSDELFYNNCKNVITGADNFTVLFDGTYVSLRDLDLGIKAVSHNKEALTRFHMLTEAEHADAENQSHWITKTSTVGTTVVSREKLDANLDVIESMSDGITTKYVRDAQGRITEESVAELYKRKITYTSASVTMEEVDPTTGATINSVKYFLYSTWGTVYKIEVRDANGVLQTRTKDTHDDAKSILLKKEFGTGLARANNLSYAKGMFASTYDSSLNYEFAYDGKGSLESVSKNGAAIEEHLHNEADGTTTVVSKYPSEDNALHTETKVFDKYGRLHSVDGILDNQYRIGARWTYQVNGIRRSTMDEYDRATHGDLEQRFVGIDDSTDDTETDGKDASLAVMTDHLTNEVTRYGYYSGLPTAAVTRNASNDALLRQETFVYDKIGRLTENRFDYDIANGDHVISRFTYLHHENEPLANHQVDQSSYSINGATRAFTLNSYDTFNRIKTKKYSISGKWFERTFTYDKNRISQEMHGSSVTNYQYDDLSRIIGINGNNMPISYVYDTYGQLTRENNKVLDKTFVYEYNNSGGISKVKEYAYTTGTLSGTPVTKSFTYDGTYPDRLTAYGGTSISYNAMGCPTTVNGYTATWTRGKLSKLTKGSIRTGTETYNYTYNAFGQRIGINYNYMAGTSSSSAIVMGMLTSYSQTFKYDQSGRLISEKKTSQYYGEGSVTEKIVYLYDECGIIGMVLEGSAAAGTYYFQRNLLGDVIGIYDTRGKKVAGYAYDAWGKCTITSDTEIYDVAHANPIRYRGYYYDEDTKLYYLNARYYSPEWRRFISPDDTGYLDPESVNGLNLYAYCGNDPVNRVDPSGHSSTAWWEWALAGIVVTGLIVGAVFTGGTLVGAALAGAAIGAGMSLGIQALSGDLSWSQFVLDTGVGALTGLIGGSGLSRRSATMLGGAIGAGSNLATQLINGEDISIMQILIAGAIGAASGFIGGAGARNKAAINQGKGVQSATKQLNKVIRRIANGYRYNATTAQVAFTNAMNGLTNAISSQMGRMFATAMVSYGISTVAFAGVDAGFDYLGWWFF